MTDTVIGEIQKNASEVVQIALREFKGHRFIDQRVMVQNKAGQMVHTPKGYGISPALLPELIEHLQRAHAEAVKQGLA